MQDRRRYRRIPIGLTLEVDKLYKQDSMQLVGLKLEIEVVNISKTGIGFVSTQDIPLDYYFNARIDFGDDEFFYTVLKIVRREALEDDVKLYGCEFVGLAQFLANKVDQYEQKLKTNSSY
ncbi:MAG: PilZ protein [Clostridiales bacterium]|jgi:hypothetical protein|nr:PilZ protein [Clostridiales bacterium]